MKTTYDPELRNSPAGKSLYYYWKLVRQNPHPPEWDDYPTFYEWAMSSGYELEYKLYLVNTKLPYSPDNCVWKPKPDGRIDADRAAEWNAAVNRLRKLFGMEPLEGT